MTGNDELKKRKDRRKMKSKKKFKKNGRANTVMGKV